MGFGGCALDPTVKVRSFENEVAAETAAGAKCNSMRFGYFLGVGSASKDDTLSDPHWLLMIAYKPSEQ
jgi:hypothetical protein